MTTLFFKPLRKYGGITPEGSKDPGVAIETYVLDADVDIDFSLPLQKQSNIVGKIEWECCRPHQFDKPEMGLFYVYLLGPDTGSGDNGRSAVGDTYKLADAEQYIDDVINKRNINIEMWNYGHWKTKGIFKELTNYNYSGDKKYYCAVHKDEYYGYKDRYESTLEAAIEAAQNEKQKEIDDLQQQLNSISEQLAMCQAIEIKVNLEQENEQ